LHCRLFATALTSLQSLRLQAMIFRFHGLVVFSCKKLFFDQDVYSEDLREGKRSSSHA
jgi:hypothetical protein